MSTYNFNITKNNDTDLKKDILSKMSEIREKYNSDEEYYKFFYDVVYVLNMIDINSNITLNINEDSTYTLTYLSNNESKTITGNLNIIKGVFDELSTDLKDVLTITTDPQTTDSKKTDIQTTDPQTTDPQTTDIQTTDSQITDIQTTDSKKTDIQITDSQTTKSQTTDSQTTDPQITDIQTTDSQTTYGDSSSVSAKASTNITGKPEEKKGFLGLWGGNKNSESDFESDGSIISSDDESEDIVPYMTAVFDDDDDEEDLMDYVKNMKSKKYLKTLNNLDLRDILRKNNQVISKNNNYLSKKDMIKSITQFYK